MGKKLGTTPHLYVRPLLHGLTAGDQPFELVQNIPAVNALSFSKQSGDMTAAFLSPIDYARHAADYRLVPGVCVSSAGSPGVIRLYIREGAKNIESLAADPAGTSEIIFSKILLAERFRNLDSAHTLTVVPVQDDPLNHLGAVDAALVTSYGPPPEPRPGVFCLDLVEEWADLTGLPYVFGFWVGRENDLVEGDVLALVNAAADGLANLPAVAMEAAPVFGRTAESCRDYFEQFSFRLANPELESIEEFIKFSYYYNVLADIPDLLFFETGERTEE